MKCVILSLSMLLCASSVFGQGGTDPNECIEFLNVNTGCAVQGMQFPDCPSSVHQIQDPSMPQGFMMWVCNGNQSYIHECTVPSTL